jgi:hypothetical protein
MSCNRNWFDTCHENINDVHKIYLGDDRSHEIKGYGDVSVTLLTGEVKQIHNVMYVQGIKKNLISISTIANQDLKVEFVKLQCVVKDMITTKSLQGDLELEDYIILMLQGGIIKRWHPQLCQWKSYGIKGMDT